MPRLARAGLPAPMLVATSTRQRLADGEGERELPEVEVHAYTVAGELRPAEDQRARERYITSRRNTLRYLRKPLPSARPTR
jgi:hypothetical protein